MFHWNIFIQEIISSQIDCFYEIIKLKQKLSFGHSSCSRWRYGFKTEGQRRNDFRKRKSRSWGYQQGPFCIQVSAQDWCFLEWDLREHREYHLLLQQPWLGILMLQLQQPCSWGLLDTDLEIEVVRPLQGSNPLQTW